MGKIYKYWEYDGEIRLPSDSEILHVGYQNSPFGKGIAAWAIVHAQEKSNYEKKISLIMTGSSVPLNSKYICSFEADGGLMYHAFECIG